MKRFLPVVSFTFPEGSVTRFEVDVLSPPIEDHEADLLEAKLLGTAQAIEPAATAPVEPEAPAPEAPAEHEGDQPQT